jgi:23S rRNA (guanosine2251-2'-O)-methyltransferase
MREETLYGVHPVLAAMAEPRRRVTKIFLDRRRQGPTIQHLVGLAGQQGIPVELVTGLYLDRLVGHGQHQGVMAHAAPAVPYTLADVLPWLESTQKPQTILLLDQITDVGNFAALLRSADAFGTEIIILPRHHSVPLSPTVAKRSAGALDKVRVVQVGNVARTLVDLKRLGFWIYGADMRADTPVAHVTWPARVVLVLGSEESGLRRLVRASCDTLVHVPMRVGVDSLNVAVAGAIILAYIWNGRMASQAMDAAER